MRAIIVGVCALVITAAVTPACIAAARRWNVLDRPGPLKPQGIPVPYFGGLAVFCGIAVSGLASRPLSLIPIVVALVLGTADDMLSLPAQLRLVAQLGIGLLVALVVPLHLSWWIGSSLLIVASVVLINGFNLLDGLDMLAGGVGAVGAVGFAILLTGPSRVLAAGIVGSLLAFLWFNRPPARIYLGDGGAYLAGTAMAVLLANAWRAGVGSPTGVLSLALLVIPAAEVVCAIVRRWRSGRSLLEGDRRHPYDLLVAKGWPGAAVSGVYVGAQALIVIVIAFADHASMITALLIDVLVVAAILGAAALLGGLKGLAETRP